MASLEKPVNDSQADGFRMACDAMSKLLVEVGNQRGADKATLWDVAVALRKMRKEAIEDGWER